MALLLVLVAGCRSITRSGGFYYGRFLAEHCLVFVLIFVYSIIAPLLLIPGTLFFGLATIVYKRQLLWCYEPELSAGGTFFPQCFRRVVWGIISSQIALTCMVAVLEEYDKIIFVILLPPITLLWSKYIHRIFQSKAEGLPLTTAMMVDDEANEQCGGAERRGESMMDSYTQPSLISDPEPIYRGDGGYDRTTRRILACCCPYSGREQEDATEDDGDEETPFVHMPRRVTRGLSWGRKYSANV